MNNEKDFSDIKIILASKSPRRTELLRQIGIDPIVLHPDVDESNIVLPGNEITQFLALQKASKIAQITKEFAFVIGVDTVVLKNDQTFGKPKNRDDAFQILKQLQGCSHQVVSSVCIYKTPEMKFVIKSSSSTILFTELTSNEISAYLDTGEYVDKAGAYAIQGKASIFIRSINGSYSNIVGLPLFELSEALSELGYDIRDNW